MKTDALIVRYLHSNTNCEKSKVSRGGGEGMMLNLPHLSQVKAIFAVRLGEPDDFSSLLRFSSEGEVDVNLIFSPSGGPASTKEIGK